MNRQREALRGNGDAIDAPTRANRRDPTAPMARNLTVEQISHIASVENPMAEGRNRPFVAMPPHACSPSVPADHR